MAVDMSAAIPEQHQGDNDFSIRSIDLQSLGTAASPVVVLDNFRVRGRPFPPHPHAGFSAVTYVFEDSRGDLRSRDSLGNDFVTGPGGVVWTQAGRGVIHEELPARGDRELHGLQLFVNLKSQNKLSSPKVFRLTSKEVPEWQSGAGDRVRVVVGSFEDASSPLVPVEPFILLDVTLQREISFHLQQGYNAIVYVLGGEIVASAENRRQHVAGGQALALRGDGLVRFETMLRAHLVILSGAEIPEPVVIEGSFIVNDVAEIELALARYRAGQMGHLLPAPDLKVAPSVG
jgi:redox-sensitive bicupin YhaK (pirin superfamily)